MRIGPIGIHLCHPWSDCDGAPYRLYLHTRKGVWIIGEKSQVYDRRQHVYTDRWAYITFHPRKEAP